jgi:hypothetical protein
MRRRYLLWILSSVVIILSGCATGKEARDVARVTLAQIITYEELVDQKIKGEQTYYKDSVSILGESLQWRQFTAEAGIVTRAAQDFRRKVSNSQKDLQTSDLRDAVDKLLESIRQSRASYAFALTEYNEDLLKSLDALELQKQSLEKVRKGLEQLQSESSDVKRLKEWFEFAKKTKDEFEKSKLSGTQK